ncbi:MAG TPA: hypothetical protein VFC44_10290 [Candidatus Saccharimonadales bacterium]|nr:hypothetical protein [Candidatus Saccharimonadales bacterium]
MKFPTLPFCALWLAAVMTSAQSSDHWVTAQSFSRQFTAQELRHYSPRSVSPMATRVPIAGSWAFLVAAVPSSPKMERDKIALEPALLVVSCERLKESFLWEMGMKDEWQGTISLLINPSLTDEVGPSLTAIHHPSGWNYELELSKTIKPAILIRAVIQTLLVEMANRKAGGQSAEIPFWLAEGLSAHLQAYNLPMFVIQPNVQTVGARVTIEGANVIRARLREQQPLSFQQLSWPEPSDLTGPSQPLYRSCAQLFLENLLQFKDGHACLRRMLEEMPQHLNWQTAFLIGFHSHFAQLLDVEKWWGLTCVTFTGGDVMTPWTAEQCWRKLQEALDVPAQVHLDSAHLPTRAHMTLQEIITEWDPGDVQHALERTVQELEVLRWRGAPAVRPLVQQYMAALDNYLRKSRLDKQLASVKKIPTYHQRAMQKEAVRELDGLDKRRASLRARFFPGYRVSQLSSLATSHP